MGSGAVTQFSSRRPVTAFFRRRADAEETIGRLAAAGVARDRVRLTPGDGERSLRPAGGTGPLPFPEASARLWEALRRLFLPRTKNNTGHQGSRRDGCLVSVRAGEADYELIAAILGDKGVIKAAKCHPSLSARSRGHEGDRSLMSQAEC